MSLGHKYLEISSCQQKMLTLRIFFTKFNCPLIETVQFDWFLQFYLLLVQELPFSVFDIYFLDQKAKNGLVLYCVQVCVGFFLKSFLFFVDQFLGWENVIKLKNRRWKKSKPNGNWHQESHPKRTFLLCQLSFAAWPLLVWSNGMF